MRLAIPKTVIRLGWVSLLADVASEMVYPIIPLFLNSVLKSGAMTLGWIEGIAEAIVSVMKGWSGLHSDRSGKRTPLIRAGYGLSAVGKPLLALSSSWVFVLVARSVDRIGKGVRTTPRDALIADAVAETSSRGAAFGFHRAMDTAGALVGVAICYALLSIELPYKTIFMLAAIPALLSVAVAWTVREVRSPKEQFAQRLTLKQSIRGMSREYWISMAAALLFGIANSSDTFLLMRAKELGLADSTVVLTYAAYNIVFMLISYPAGKLSDRTGRWLILSVGWLLYSFAYTAFGRIGQGDTVLLFGTFAIYGMYMGLTKGVTSAMIADHAPADRRGSAIGLFLMLSGLATLIASALTGVLWEYYGSRVALTIDAVLALLAAAYMFAMHRTLRQ